jgi:uncharacterized protein (DUF169 family)
MVMDKALKDKFLSLWERFFNGSELPVVFFYTDDEDRAEHARPAKGHRCIIGDLAQVRKGRSLQFDMASLGCPGSKRYLGFSASLAPRFEYFLSCGIPGELEGERYKKGPEQVREFMKHVPSFEAPRKNIVFKRWDNLEERDEPDVAVFFARPDTLSGLFTLANFLSVDPGEVVTLFGSACMNTIMFPYLESSKDGPRAFIGTFDPSARPFVQDDVLTFAVPIKKLRLMIDTMEESFLITPTWDLIRRRIRR